MKKLLLGITVLALVLFASSAMAQDALTGRSEIPPLALATEKLSADIACDSQCIGKYVSTYTGGNGILLTGSTGRCGKHPQCRPSTKARPSG